MPSQSRARRKRPVEYSILYTATLCMLAGGAVMVYSASSAESLLGAGDPSMYLKRYVLFGLLGLVALNLAARHGLALARRLTPILLVGSFVLVVAVMLPGVGVTINGATRWLAAGPFQFQPSELLKLSLVLYAANLLAERPETVKSLGGLFKPLLVVVGAACALLMKQPDMGTAMVICFAMGALLVAAGTPVRLHRHAVRRASPGWRWWRRSSSHTGCGGSRRSSTRSPTRATAASRRCRRSRPSGRAACSAWGWASRCRRSTTCRRRTRT